VKPVRDIVERAVSDSVVAVAALWRSRLRDTLFVGITGSSGKTTTKELCAAALGTRLSGIRNWDTKNSLRYLVPQMLRVRPSDAVCLQELGAGGPDSLDRCIALLRPRVGVVTTVGLEHYKAFRTREAVATEKVKLVEALPPEGVAILNADDPLVAAMAARCRGRVSTFGLHAGADVRGSEVSAAWPDRLSLTAHACGATVPVRTRLCGAHWAPCVLAALATGKTLGIPLEEMAGALARVEPWPGRMSVVERADGVTFVRDDYKAPVGSLPPLFDFLRAARAPRKVLVIGTLSDYPGSNEKRYAAVAREALAVADHVLFVGRWARGALKAGGSDSRLRAAASLREAAAALEDLLRAGDLVALKGSLTVDHLHRLIPAPAGPPLTRAGRRFP
jgi:UDP-N-acetylmuramyl pentapeptide synthase